MEYFAELYRSLRAVRIQPANNENKTLLLTGRMGLYSPSEHETDSDSSYDFTENDGMYNGSANDSDDDEDDDIINSKYYLGSYKNLDDEVLIIGTRIGVKWFYNNTYDNIHEYLYSYSSMFIDDIRLQIIQCFVRRYNWRTNVFLEYANDYTNDSSISTMYICILKTFWIRLIQRTWKRIYKEKQRYLKTIQNNILCMNRAREFGGYIVSNNGLQGMLNYLVLQKQGLFVKG